MFGSPGVWGGGACSGVARGGATLLEFVEARSDSVLSGSPSEIAPFGSGCAPGCARGAHRCAAS
eukprot:8688983-Pyramimonas_sp.AAC.1